MMQTPDSSNPCTTPFADRHIHGVAGVDFATSNVSDIRAALSLLVRRRTTTVIASLPALEITALEETLDRLQGFHTAGLLAGVHLEGPFLAPDYAGAHPRSALLTPATIPGRDLLARVLNYQSRTSLVTMMTVAPELAGFTTLVEHLVDQGIEPALGHTGATYEQMRDAIAHVTTLTGRPAVITHLYNAMRGFHHRDPGPLLAIAQAARTGDVIVELIADGVHVDLELVRWWFQHYPTAVRLVSDASAATNLPGQEPISTAPARLGHHVLGSSSSNSPSLDDGHTIASGSKDLLTIHDDLVGLGFTHDAVCAAMY